MALFKNSPKNLAEGFYKEIQVPFGRANGMYNGDWQNGVCWSEENFRKEYSDYCARIHNYKIPFKKLDQLVSKTFPRVIELLENNSLIYSLSIAEKDLLQLLGSTNEMKAGKYFTSAREGQTKEDRLDLLKSVIADRLIQSKLYQNAPFLNLQVAMDEVYLNEEKHYLEEIEDFERQSLELEALHLKRSRLREEYLLTHNYQDLASAAKITQERLDLDNTTLKEVEYLFARPRSQTKQTKDKELAITLRREQLKNNATIAKQKVEALELAAEEYINRHPINSEIDALTTTRKELFNHLTEVGRNLIDLQRSRKQEILKEIEPIRDNDSLMNF